MLLNSISWELKIRYHQNQIPPSLTPSVAKRKIFPLKYAKTAKTGAKIEMIGNE